MESSSVSLVADSVGSEESVSSGSDSLGVSLPVSSVPDSESFENSGISSSEGSSGSSSSSSGDCELSSHRGSLSLEASPFSVESF